MCVKISATGGGHNQGATKALTLESKTDKDFS